MSDAAAEAPTQPPEEAATRRSWLSWKIIVPVVLVLVLAGGGAAYFFLIMRPAGQGEQAAKPETALPFYLEIKPFVVSMKGADDNSHFVQLGINLLLSGPELGNLVSAVEPEVDDAMRLSALHFKVEDIVTPAGVDKMRAAMVADINRVLAQRLGIDRIQRLNGGSKDAVRTLYFSQLVIE
jgi:flagellar FliL protein